MMKALYKTEGSQFRIEIIESPKVQEFISTHSDALNSAFQQVKMSDTMRQRLQRSNYIFSGMKTFHELNEAFPALIDENGSRKPFEQFLNDVRKIDNTYNKNYLRAEYNFCQASADMAAKWEGFMQDGDRYNLQYRTQRDNKVRPEHAALDRVTLPMSDPFWQEYYPPNGWNCRCTVVQVRKSKYPETPHEEAMSLGEEATGKDTKGIFHFNPGIEQKAFPDYNPYTIRRCKDCDIAKGKIKLTFVPDNELCAICKLLRKGLAMYGETRSEGNGTVTIHQFVNRNDSDFKKLNEIATFFAREQGAEVILTPKMSRPPKFQYECIYGSLIDTVYEGKCPDICVNGIWYEHEGFISTNPKNAFRNMMRDGLIQCDRLIIDRPDLTERFMLRSIIGRVKRGEAIKEVWLREKDGTVKLLYKNTDG
ncbi:MAG: minor capsid protein [Bacteroidaceae bacterium]|nr:minor capsid protein [Bacteroidaceae bacterium]